MGTTKNMQFLRTSNRAAIIKALALGEASNRVELSSHLGLSKMAISGLINDLVADGYVEDRKYSPFRDSTWYTGDASGRKPSALSIVPRRIHAIGILLKRYEVHCLIAEIQGNILYHDFCALPQNADNLSLSEILVSLVEKALRAHEDRFMAGIGIASIGPLDITQKKILYPPNFCSIGNLDMGELLEEKFHLPVYLDNDMNASAIAEQFYGVGKTADTLAYVGFGSGVGAGIIIHGKLLHGSAGFAGEIGHISINPQGPLCSCGQKGCIETYTSVSKLLDDMGTDSVSNLWQMIQDNKLDGPKKERLEACRYALKTLLITIANLYDPEVIIFGEIPPKLTPIYLDEMEAYMNANMFHHGFQNIRLYPSSFGENVPLIGSASLIFKRIFDGKIPLPDKVPD